MPLHWRNQFFWQIFGGRCRQAMLGARCGLCLQIWRLFPVVNTKQSHRRRRYGARTVDYALVSGAKHSHRRRRQRREPWIMPWYPALSIVTDGEDMGRELWTMPWYPALSIVTDGEDRARGENCGLRLVIRRLFAVVGGSAVTHGEEGGEEVGADGNDDEAAGVVHVVNPRAVGHAASDELLV